MPADEQHARVYDLHHHRPRPLIHGTAALDPRGDAGDSPPLVVDVAASSQDQSPPAGPGDGVPRLQPWHAVFRRVRPHRARGRTRRAEPTIDHIVARDRVRTRRARRYAKLRRFGGATLRRTGRGVVVLIRGCARGVGHFLWLPLLGADIRAMTDYNLKARMQSDLYRARVVRIGGGFLVTGVTWLAWPWLGPRLGHSLAGGEQGWTWWALLLMSAAAAAGLWALGWTHEVEQAEHQADELPPGIRAGDSARSVERTFGEAFEALKIEGRVQAAHVGGTWGWIVTTDVLSDLGRTELDRLARRLDAPRGGLLVSSPRESSRARVFRLVLTDLLLPGQAPAVHPDEPLSVPRRLGRRFDGGDLAVVLAGLHIAVFGRTGSGKTSVLAGLMDAYLSAGAVVGAIDMTGGSDTRAWEPALNPALCAFSDDAAAVLRVLQRVKAIALRRKTDTAAGSQWVSTPRRPPIRLVVDEYGVVAANAALLTEVNWLILYGRNVDIHVVVAGHRPVADIMGDGTVGSQVHVKIYCAMAAEDVRGLPKTVRDQGVAPEQLVPSDRVNAHDAGKAYVVGLENPAPLVRFPGYTDGENRRRAEVYAKTSLGQLGGADAEAMFAAENATQGLPDLLRWMREAIVNASDDGRPEPKATSEEIAAYLRSKGVSVTVANLTATVRSELRAAFPAKRREDTNLHGRNQKGWYLEDLDQALERYTALQR